MSFTPSAPCEKSTRQTAPAGDGLKPSPADASRQTNGTSISATRVRVRLMGLRSALFLSVDQSEEINESASGTGQAGKTPPTVINVPTKPGQWQKIALDYASVGEWISFQVVSDFCRASQRHKCRMPLNSAAAGLSGSNGRRHRRQRQARRGCERAPNGHFSAPNDHQPATAMRKTSTVLLPSRTTRGEKRKTMTRPSFQPLTPRDELGLIRVFHRLNRGSLPGFSFEWARATAFRVSNFDIQSQTMNADRRTH